MMPPTSAFKMETGPREKTAPDPQGFESAIAELALRALTCDSIEAQAEAVAERVRELLDVDGCGVFRLAADGTVEPCGTIGLPEPIEALSLGRSALDGREPLVCEEIGSAEPTALRRLLERLEGTAGIVAPIGFDPPWGVLAAVNRKARRFHKPEVDLVRALAHIVLEAVSVRQPSEKHMGQAMLAGVAHRMPALMWVTDTDLRVRHALGAGLVQFLELEEFLGKTLYEFFETEYLNFPPIVAHRAALYGQTRTYHYRLGGVPLEVWVEPLRDSQGLVVGTVGIAIDISNRDHIEERVRLLSTAVESAAHAIVVTDRDGQITWANSAFTELTGYSLEEALGKNPGILKSGQHGREAYEKLWKTILSGRVWKGELVNRRKDGSLYTELQTITPVSDADGAISHFISLKQDVSEAKELEEQFRQAQKMEAVGRLAGGVAHDFNNLLTAIIGYSELLLTDFHADDPRHTDLAAIKGAAERASSLTRQLLAFSRRQVLQPKVLDLNTSISGMAKMVQRLIGEDVELVLTLDDALGRVKADPGQIEQVIMNLAVNARDAMPHGGKLTLETQNVELDDAYHQRPFVHPGPYVMVAVSDTGSGMKAETLSHVFEPFFTTKEAGKGTGLGLSTVYGIVKQSGGYIWAYSEPDLGTTFKIFLPRIDAPMESAGHEETIPTPHGSETLLLVEDEDVVRRLARRMLEAYGYTVLEARNGAEALHISRQHEGSINLLLTDVVMPLMGGQELAERLAPLRPEMKVLYMSGYTDEAIARHGLLEPGTMLLQKPFSKSAFLEKVRLALRRDESEDGSSPS